MSDLMDKFTIVKSDWVNPDLLAMIEVTDNYQLAEAWAECFYALLCHYDPVLGEKATPVLDYIKLSIEFSQAKHH